MLGLNITVNRVVHCGIQLPRTGLYCPNSTVFNPVGSERLIGSLWQRSPIRDSNSLGKNAVLAFSNVTAGGSDAGAPGRNAAWLVDESKRASAVTKSRIARRIEC